MTEQLTKLRFPGAFHSIAGASGKIFVGHKQMANLAKHMGEQSGVADARGRLSEQLGCEIQWLRQVHGIDVFDADISIAANKDVGSAKQDPVADAAITGRANIAIAILTADCLPVMFADVDGRFVAGAHAGWRGLVNGILDKTIASFIDRGIAPQNIRAFLGPAIGKSAFEVGSEVRQTFLELAQPHELVATESAFVSNLADGSKWLANLVALAAVRLARFGVSIEHDAISKSASFCTYSNPTDYFSYRYFCHHPHVLDGRQATLIWRPQ
jgi:polyphenol oxidase